LQSFFSNLLLGQDFSIFLGRLLIEPIWIFLDGALDRVTLTFVFAFKATEEAKEIAHILYLQDTIKM